MIDELLEDDVLVDEELEDELLLVVLELVLVLVLMLVLVLLLVLVLVLELDEVEVAEVVDDEDEEVSDFGGVSSLAGESETTARPNSRPRLLPLMPGRYRACPVASRWG